MKTLLTLREFQVMQFAAQGYTSKEIARLMGLHYRTIETYMINLKRKLDAKNMPHAIFLACKSCILK